MPLSFFRVLDPRSKKSGILYLHDYRKPGQEVIDQTVSEQINKAWAKQLNLSEGFVETFNILYGRHYSAWQTGTAYEDCAKGVLDYLILPLIARKIRMFDRECMTEELFQYGISEFINWQSVLTFVVVLPIEIVRFSAAIALTLILAPVVAIVTYARGYLNSIESPPPGDAPGGSSILFVN